MKNRFGYEETAIDAFARPSDNGYTLHHIECKEKHPPQYATKEPMLGTYMTCKCGTKVIIKREKSLWS